MTESLILILISTLRNVFHSSNCQCVWECDKHLCDNGETENQKFQSKNESHNRHIATYHPNQMEYTKGLRLKPRYKEVLRLFPCSLPSIRVLFSLIHFYYIWASIQAFRTVIKIIIFFHHPSGIVYSKCLYYNDIKTWLKQKRMILANQQNYSIDGTLN